MQHYNMDTTLIDNAHLMSMNEEETRKHFTPTPRQAALDRLWIKAQLRDKAKNAIVLDEVIYQQLDEKHIYWMNTETKAEWKQIITGYSKSKHKQIDDRITKGSRQTLENIETANNFLFG